EAAWSDQPVLSLERVDRLDWRVACKEADGRVQTTAGEQQQRKSGTGLFVIDANRASFVELARRSGLLGEQARHGGGCRCCNTRAQNRASGRIHLQRPPCPPIVIAVKPIRRKSLEQLRYCVATTMDTKDTKV